MPERRSAHLGSTVAPGAAIRRLAASGLPDKASVASAPRVWSTLHYVAGALLLAAASCTIIPTRAPAPEAGLGDARPYGLAVPLLRAWGDEVGQDAVDAIIGSRVAALRRVHASTLQAGLPLQRTMLALSGGGPDGAFGAGLLAGWTERGDRPRFDIVTGVSTGAIIALFAFLGPDYDEALRDIYTNYSTRDLLTPAILTGLLRGSALTDNAGFRRLIDKYVDDAVMRRLADAYADGRLLLVGTTNLDAARPVVWNIGAIAASGHPRARRLVRDVIEASAAIPGAFPPVLVPVEIQGVTYDEMHVDGGATRQVLLFTPELRMGRIDEALGVDRTLYVIINNRLRRAYSPVAPRLRPIMATAISSLIAGAGSGDVIQLYAAADREGFPLRFISIPPDFDLEPAEPFDRAYMRALYDLGFQTGREGAPWLQIPPGFVVERGG